MPWEEMELFPRPRTVHVGRIMKTSFWEALDRLVADSVVVIEQPRGSIDARFPDFRFPNDYGHLEGTNAPDGEEVDVWVGSQPEHRVTGIICTVDLAKRDAELKILIACAPDEIVRILETHNMGNQSGVLIEREFKE
jgi:inorganic pyrophosphatase